MVSLLEPRAVNRSLWISLYFVPRNGCDPSDSSLSWNVNSNISTNWDANSWSFYFFWKMVILRKKNCIIFITQKSNCCIRCPASRTHCFISLHIFLDQKKTIDRISCIYFCSSGLSLGERNDIDRLFSSISIKGHKKIRNAAYARSLAKSRFSRIVKCTQNFGSETASVLRSPILKNKARGSLLTNQRAIGYWSRNLLTMCM